MAAYLITKILGFVFRIQFVRIAGEEAVGIYMQCSLPLFFPIRHSTRSSCWYFVPRDKLHDALIVSRISDRQAFYHSQGRFQLEVNFYLKYSLGANENHTKTPCAVTVLMGLF